MKINVCFVCGARWCDKKSDFIEEHILPCYNYRYDDACLRTIDEKEYSKYRSKNDQRKSIYERL